MRLICLLTVILVLSGCQTSRPFGLFRTSPLIAYENSQVRSLASEASALSSVSGRPINPDDYPFFSQSSFGKEWLGKRNHRVIAIGHPAECATYNSRWGHGRLYQAIEMAMSQCLSRVKEFARHTNKKCGCRLAAVNNNVLMAPEELPFRKNVPAIGLVKDESGRREILGYVETTGRTGQNQPMIFFTQSGQKVCDGSYNLGTLSFKGDAKLNCFGGRIQGPALFKVAGFREGQAFGTALVNAGENQLILVYGLPTEEFRKRRADLLNE